MVLTRFSGTWRQATGSANGGRQWPKSRCFASLDWCHEQADELE